MIIPASVTTIGYSAFGSGALREVIFAPNSQLTTIEADAFASNFITHMDLPANLTHVGENGLDLLETLTYKGTVAEWNNITFDYGLDNSVLAIEVVCTDGVVTLKEPGLYDEYMELTNNWNELISQTKINVGGTIINCD